MRPVGRTAEAMLQQRGHLAGWIPVCLAIGIGVYFALRLEPDAGTLYGTAAVAVLSLGITWRLPEWVSPLASAAALICIGFLLAAARAHSLAAPVLDWRYYGPVEGRIVALDRSQSDAPRLTLDEVRLSRVAPDETPVRVRISLHGETPGGILPRPGLRVMTTAHLSPPGGPVEPGGFDFQRHAWFARLGAVGYTRVPLMGVAPAAEGQAGLAVFRLRMAASAYIRGILSGDVGGFAAAITTGDRSAMGQATLEDLRASNLAHLLAISGLHMGLLTALVFGALRLMLAAVPYTALRWPTRSIAAGGALIAASGYLALSGGNVATERAFVMVAVALCALMIGRRALSLRAVAIAATIVLVLRPEALTGPGFQMSFAATTALVAVFGWLREARFQRAPKWIRPVGAVVLSSAVAGGATAPIGAAHFNAIAHYGLVANLLSVPLMGLLVIPAALIALVLWPIGLDYLGLWAMGAGLQWILGVADWIASTEGARGWVPGPGPWVLPLLSFGALFVILWQGRVRWLGLLAMGAALWLWQGTDRPTVLIADTGTLMGVMTPEGRALSKPRGAGFVAGNWLENDGSGATQEEAAALWPGVRTVAGKTAVHLSGKRKVEAFGPCIGSQILVTSADFSALRGPDCVVFDPEYLRRTGAVALYDEEGTLRIVTARERAGERLWSRWPD